MLKYALSTLFNTHKFLKACHSSVVSLILAHVNLVKRVRANEQIIYIPIRFNTRISNRVISCNKTVPVLKFWSIQSHTCSIGVGVRWGSLKDVVACNAYNKWKWKKRNIRGKLKLQGILHLLKQKIFLSNTLIVGFICFINQSQNDVPNFFLRVCAVVLIKNGEK